MGLAHSPRIVTDGLVLAIDAGNPKSFIATGDKNLINPGTWNNEFSGSQTGFTQNGSGTENYVISDTDPFGNLANLWEARPSGDNNGDGGWATSSFIIDNTKTYRFSVWVNRTVTGTSGAFYMGFYGATSGGSYNNVLSRATGATNANPYFWTSSNPPTQAELATGEWTLVVGHVHPVDSGTGASHVDSGVYKLDGTKKSIAVNDFVWTAENARAVHRTYLFYSTTVIPRQRWAYPRVDLVDGTEPTIADLIANRVNNLYTKNMVGTDSGILRNGTSYSSADAGTFFFDGSYNFMSGTLAPPAFNSSSTIEAFVKPAFVTGGLRAIFVHGRTGVSFSNGLVILDGQIRFRNSNNDYAFPSPTTLSNGSWYHIVLSTDANGTTGYCNGVSQGTIPYKITSNSLPEWNIGRRSLNSNIERFVGNLAVLRVYQNKALTEAEVKQNFNALRGRYGI